MNQLFSILYETDNTGKSQLSQGRIYCFVAFATCMAFWIKALITGLAIDAPSSLVVVLTALLTYVGVGKGVNVWKEIKFNGNGNGTAQ